MEDIRLKELRYLIESFSESDNLTDVALKNIIEYLDYTEIRFNKVVLDHKAVVETMQNKIEELEKRLLKYKGLVKICKGAGQCDYDGSTCNKYDNCGEYDPVIRGIAKGIK